MAICHGDNVLCNQFPPAPNKPHLQPLLYHHGHNLKDHVLANNPSKATGYNGSHFVNRGLDHDSCDLIFV